MHICGMAECRKFCRVLPQNATSKWKMQTSSLAISIISLANLAGLRGVLGACLALCLCAREPSRRQLRSSAASIRGAHYSAALVI
jgi:hypothetical protein